MKWHDHSKWKTDEDHAFLSPSQYHWINYTDEKLLTVYKAHLAAKRGTVLHGFAKMCIELRQKLPKSTKTLNMYVNDAIGFGLSPERRLYYSENCFGTSDAIGFKRNFLRVHDLKTGVSKASFRQLDLYSAIFCLEYGKNPFELDGIEERIYQNDDIAIFQPDPADISQLMDTIKRFDQLITKIKEGQDEL